MERVIASNLYDSGFDKQNALEPAVEANHITGNQHLFDEVEGFTDEDLEKPNFPGKQLSEKVPLVLSDVDATPVVQVPSTINRYLREYQKEGIAFLYRQYSCRKGAILADDMGLGKTVQVIGFISAVLGKTGTKIDIYGKFLPENEKVSLNRVKKEKGAFLIVSPNSVLYNWHEELMSWGYFKIGKFHKNKRDETFEKAAAGKLDIVLTTYETLRNHWESLNKIKWLAVIMDEVHHLKDPKRAVTIASKSLNVKCRIGLTGTPLQNRLLDFWSVLDWANPGCLGDKEDFTYDFSRPIMRGQRFDGTKRELATGRKKTQEFQSMIDDWCLRRTKALIADQLPQKDQKVVFCPLSKLQEDIYKTLLQTDDVQLVLKQGEPCDCRSELTRGKCCYTVNEEGSNMKKLLLQCLRLFLKISNHAALLLPHVKQTDDQRKRAKSICEKVFAVHPEFEESSKSPSFELFSDSNFCGKMKVLDKLLKLFKQQKDKVLLFSYSTQLLDMLEAYVISCGMVYRRLDGKTRGERRLDVVREFNMNSDIFLFLVSTKAGGVGLNLTSANIVIVFDPSWNPADDLQAEDRAYRIGQRRDVKVFRLISTGTVEENMYLRQIYKQQLANIAVEGNHERRYFTAVDGEKDQKGELFGIENLFALRIHDCSVSTDIFKRSEKIEKGFRMRKYELQPKEDPVEKMDCEQSITPPVQCMETEEGEENSYNLEEISSQFIEDDITDVDCVGNKPQEQKMSPKLNISGNVLDISSEFTKNCESHEKRETNFTKVLDISDEIEKLAEGFTPSRGNEKQKRQKSKQNPESSKKRPLSKDSQVNQILEDCGVQHTHSNKMIIGSSEAENEMTSRAMKEVFYLGQYSQQPANCFAAVESDGEESDDVGDHTERESNVKTEEDCNLQKTENTSCSVPKKVQTTLSMQTKADGRTILLGETPKTIRLRQFTEISEAQGYESELKFAQAVVTCNTTERLRMLMEYYKRKDYPNESVESYSQIIQSSQKMNTNIKSTEYKNVVKKKRARKPAMTRRKSSRQKSFKNDFTPPVVKPNKSDRLRNNASKYLRRKTESNPRDRSTVIETGLKEQRKTDRVKCCRSKTLEDDSTLSFGKNNDKSFGKTANHLEQKNDRITSVDSDELDNDKLENKSSNMSQKTSKIDANNYDESLSRGKDLLEAIAPVTNTENVCDDILNDILTGHSDTNYTPYSSSSEFHPTANTPLTSGRSQDSQDSSFLDELLFDCSQRSRDRTQIISSRYESSSREANSFSRSCEVMACVEKPHHCDKEQASIIDDLI